MVISALYGIVAAMTFIQLFMLIMRGGKNQNIYQLLLFVMGFICNIGYLAMSLANSVGEAILCNDIIYLGAVFLPLFVLLTISELTGVKVNKSLLVGLLVGSLIVLGFVFSVGYSDIYYADLQIESVYGTTHLVKSYGPAHNAYPILLFIYLIVAIVVVAKALRSNKNFTKRTVFSMLAVLIGPSSVYIIERIVKFPVELLPFIYVVVLGMLLNIDSRMKMYDMSSSIAGAYEKLEEYGYITFDLKKNLMNCNSMAVKIFPELRKAEIDELVKKDDSVFYNEIIRWIDSPAVKDYNEKKITIGNYSINCIVRKIHAGMRKKAIGYSVELIDNTKQENYIKLINNYNANLEEEVKAKTEHIRVIQESIITGMASMVEGRDNSTGGHIRRTSKCVKIFANVLKDDKRFAISDTFLDNVIKSAPLHDLGKIAVDDVILRKPGKFTPEEYEQMKTHSAKGAEIVAGVLKEVDDEEFKKIAVNVAHYHHEKWDGTGYPTGISGLDIPVEARIMALADVFDALVSKRCYKEAFNYDKAFNIIEESLGSHFDPELGKLFISCRSKLEALYDSLPE